MMNADEYSGDWSSSVSPSSLHFLAAELPTQDLVEHCHRHGLHQPPGGGTISQAGQTKLSFSKDHFQKFWDTFEKRL